MYIEREALLKALPPKCGTGDVYALAHNTCRNGMLDIIKNIPSADVAPVVHGEWVEKKRWAMGKWSKWLECSKCGHQDHNLDMYEDMPFVGPYNYCPNCGAKMDGGKENV